MGSPPETAPTPGRGTQTPAGGLVLWTALVIVYVVWGSTYLGIRIAVETLPPLLSAGMRFVGAGVVLVAVLAARRGVSVLNVTRRQVGAAALVGTLLLAGGNGGVVFAEAGLVGAPVPSGVAALLIALVPILVVLMRAGTGDRPRLMSVIGVLVGFGGLIALVAAGSGVDGSVPLVGSLIVVGAATSWAVGSFLSGRLPLPPNPFVTTAYESLIGGAVIGVLGFASGERLHPGEVSGRSWLALLYLLVAGSLVAFTAYAWLLQNAPISLTSTYAYVNPAVAVLLGALIVAEPVTPAILVGGLIIIVGVALVVSTERPRSRSRVDGDAVEPANR
jgi:drug/metabolite transporter (DMT)-like permease